MVGRRRIYVGAFWGAFSPLFLALRFWIAFSPFWDRFVAIFPDFASQNHPQKYAELVTKTVQKQVQKKVLFVHRFWTMFYDSSYQKINITTVKKSMRKRACSRSRTFTKHCKTRCEINIFEKRIYVRKSPRHCRNGQQNTTKSVVFLNAFFFIF